LTITSIGGLLGLLLSLVRPVPPLTSSPGSSWRQLVVLISPFSAAYLLLVLAAAGTTYTVEDRYALGLLVVALPCIVRFYQERIHPQFPLINVLLIGLTAAYGIAMTHNTFALDRARVALGDELKANGAPDTSLDGGWEPNLVVELQHADHINDFRIETPANAYVPVAPPDGPCKMFWYEKTPHIRALYGVSFDPDACYGPAPFAPVHYSRWPYTTPGTLYVVRYTPPSHP